MPALLWQSLRRWPQLQSQSASVFPFGGRLEIGLAIRMFKPFEWVSRAISSILLLCIICISLGHPRLLLVSFVNVKPVSERDALAGLNRHVAGVRRLLLEIMLAER